MFNKEKLTIGLYAFTFLVVIFIFHLFFIHGLLDKQHFLNWDAEHYYWIKNNGYEGFRVAFFPLFPFIWKILHLNVYGIVLFNAILFLIAFYYLVLHLKPGPLETLLFLSIPSFCFFFLPYTEALFFACSTILLIGLKTNKITWVYLGLFLCTLARPAFTVFLPALIVVELLSYPLNTRTAIRMLSYIFISVAGMLVVGLVQHYYTGKWFEFFEVQKAWGNQLQLPELPLNSWGGGMILRADGACLLMGLFSGIIILAKFFRFNFIKKIQLPKEVIFSLCYLAGISLTVLFFRAGLLFSLNRFFLATPFVIIVCNFYLKQPVSLNGRSIIIAFAAIFSFWLLFGSYLHIREILFFLGLTVYLFLLFFIKSKNKTVHTVAMIVLIVLNFIYQVTFFTRFLNKEWVG